MGDELDKLLQGLQTNIVQPLVQISAPPIVESSSKDLISSFFQVRIKGSKYESDKFEKYVGDRQKIRLSEVHRRQLPLDWVTVAVLVEKQPPKTSQKGSNYLVWRISDLLDCNKFVRLFLFGSAARDLWKLSVGSVFALFSPTRMENQDSDRSKDICYVALKLDQPQMLLDIGISVDLSFCKGVQKTDGQPCHNFVNKEISDFCDFHILTAGKRATARRGELQNPFNSAPKSFERRLFGQNGFLSYGGQSFVSSQNPKSSKNMNLSKSTGTPAGRIDRRATPVLNSTDGHFSGKPQQISVPTDKGSDIKKETKKLPDPKPLGFKDFIQKHLEVPKEHLTIRSQSPSVSLEVVANINSKLQADSDARAKRRAVGFLLKNGPLPVVDPNAFPGFKRSRQCSKDKGISESLEDTAGGEPPLKMPKFGDIQLSNQQLEDILKGHKHSTTSDQDASQFELYFNRLEATEKVENRLCEIKELQNCSVISCPQCHYTSQKQSDLCKAEGHRVKFSRAVKRFFKCQDCGKKAFCFSLHPTKPCHQCGSNRFSRTTYKEERCEPSLHRLELRGHEQKFIG